MLDISKVYLSSILRRTNDFLNIITLDLNAIL